MEDPRADEELLRLDPASGTMTVQARLPAASQVDSITVGLGDVWLVPVKGDGAAAARCSSGQLMLWQRADS
jgi:hypothetical protein